MLAGVFLYLIMRALGEMLYVDPDTGSFAKFAGEYIHPVFGYLTAWSNIFQFIVVGMSEMIARACGRFSGLSTSGGLALTVFLRALSS
jgi:AAT family amino acid transporter